MSDIGGIKEIRDRKKKRNRKAVIKKRKMLIFKHVEQLLLMVSSIGSGKNFEIEHQCSNLGCSEQVTYLTFLSLCSLISKIGIIIFILNEIIYNRSFCIVPGTL